MGFVESPAHVDGRADGRDRRGEVDGRASCSRSAARSSSTPTRSPVRSSSPGTPTLAKLVERFGAEILQADGSLDRPALAAVAFVDDATRKELEAITHPAIGEEFLRRVAEAPPGRGRGPRRPAARGVEAGLRVRGA